MNIKTWGYLFIFSGIAIFLYVIYANSRYVDITRPFSSYTLLISSWEKYKQQFIDKEGRVIDNTLGDVTTSEGQSYAMLRSVYLDDKMAFDLIWNWTKNNLKRPNDNLFGWKWGLNNANQYGFLEDGGFNSAADADIDIALALIFAGKRWNDNDYTEQARLILKDVWDKETAVAAGKRYLLAGNWANEPTKLIINPSYFAPYAWRIFASVDKDHDWNSLINPAYELLIESGKNNLDKNFAAGLPPDWVEVDKATGTLRAPNYANLTTNYSFDAMRVPWRIGLDYQWNKNQEAFDYLNQSFKRLSEVYHSENKLPASMAHDGQIVQAQENPTMYATAIAYFMITEPETAKKIYQDKIIKLYSNDQNMFNANLPYYEQNWLWFGSAIYNHELINLYG